MEGSGVEQPYSQPPGAREAAESLLVAVLDHLPKARVMARVEQNSLGCPAEGEYVVFPLVIFRHHHSTECLH